MPAATFDKQDAARTPRAINDRIAPGLSATDTLTRRGQVKRAGERRVPAFPVTPRYIPPLVPPISPLARQRVRRLGRPAQQLVSNASASGLLSDHATASESRWCVRMERSGGTVPCVDSDGIEYAKPQRMNVRLTLEAEDARSFSHPSWWARTEWAGHDPRRVARVFGDHVGATRLLRSRDRIN